METRNPLRIFAILVVERQVPDWSRRSERWMNANCSAKAAGGVLNQKWPVLSADRPLAI